MWFGGLRGARGGDVNVQPACATIPLPRWNLQRVLTTPRSDVCLGSPVFSRDQQSVCSPLPPGSYCVKHATTAPGARRGSTLWLEMV